MARAHEKFEFTIDGIRYSTGDKIMDGGQIRKAANKVPASEFVIVQIVEGSGRSVGLEDKVTFVEDEPMTFLSFLSDRVFTFTIDERGWEWGAGSITVADIHRYAGIDEDRELVLDSDGDKVLSFNSELALENTGVERIRSREARSATIKVNGRPRSVEKRRYSYREIAAIAYPSPDFENFNYTITYLRGIDGAEGDLVEGESIIVKNGMVFNVRRSDKS